MYVGIIYLQPMFIYVRIHMSPEVFILIISTQLVIMSFFKEYSTLHKHEK